MTVRNKFRRASLIAFILSAVGFFAVSSADLQGIALVLTFVLTFLLFVAAVLLAVSSFTKNPKKTLKIIILSDLIASLFSLN